MSEQNSTLDSIITVQEVDFFRSMAGKDYDKENKEVNEKIKSLHKKIKDASFRAANNLWGSNAGLSCKIAANNQRSQHLRIRDYLPVKIFPENKYSKIVQYWVTLNKGVEIPTIAVSLSIKDDGIAKELKDSRNNLKNSHQIENIKKIDSDVSVEELASWIEQSISGFDLDYQKFCEHMQPKLEEVLSKFLDKNRKNEDEDDGDEEHGYQFSVNTEVIKTFAKNLIYYGPPGTGKTFRLQKHQKEYDEYRFVTFHQSYGYEEFVEGLRPVLDGDDKSSLKYTMDDGVFKKLCDDARKQENKKFAIFIDEINRGNVSKIFGELITLIEIDKRGKEINLAYSKKPFSVPPNVDIIGTMNTADRSLALLDTALRRRFDFIQLYPDTSAVKVLGDEHSAPLAGLKVNGVDVRRMLEKINNRIEALYDRDHCIGHSYFTRLISIDGDATKFQEFTKIFQNQITPLLEEYFFEDWSKIELVLGDNQKKDPKLKFLEKKTDFEHKEIFGQDFSEGTMYSKSSYRWRKDSFINPEAYIGVYTQV